MVQGRESSQVVCCSESPGLHWRGSVVDLNGEFQG